MTDQNTSTEQAQTNVATAAAPTDTTAAADVAQPGSVRPVDAAAAARNPIGTGVASQQGKAREFAGDDVIVQASGLELKNLLGCPYSGIDLQIRRGQVLAVRGHNGSGKTALLLTLAARMNFTKGSLTLLGEPMPKHRGKVQRRIGMGLFDGLNDLQDSLTVRYVIASEFELYNRKPTRDAVSAYIGEWNLTDVADIRINDLTSERLVMLGVALAWVGHPELIVVDDIESQLTKAQSERIMDHLITLAHTRGVAICVGVIERDLAAMADSALYLEKEGE